MPIHREGSGWQWGQHGKVYSTRVGAERQAAAAHAHGYEGDDANSAIPMSRDMTRENWRGLITGLIKFFTEEAEEPEHGEDATFEEIRDAVKSKATDPDALAAWIKRKENPGWNPRAQDASFEEIRSAVRGKADDPDALAAWIKRRLSKDSANAAGVAVRAPTGEMLFLRRGHGGDHPGTWSFPGGYAEEDEGPEEAALRELKEETGYKAEGLESLHRAPGNVNYETFLHDAGEMFKPKLDGENTEWKWAKASEAPEPLHPGVKKALDSLSPKRASAAYKELGEDELPKDWHGTVVLSSPKPIALAFDKDTVRSYDADGRMHLSTSNISKAVVNPYYGREIPDHEQLGLDPGKLYHLLRHPDELEKAAPTFNNLPILSKHVPVTAESHPPELVIGSTGTDATFENPYLTNSLVFWPKSAIDDIESESKKELSSAYRYRADMTPGDYEGVHYDGIMRDIVGNHVALVKEGRAGADVVVGDSREALMGAKVLSRKAAVTLGALVGYLKPKLAQDARIDWGPILGDVTAANFKEKKAEIATKVKEAAKPFLAKDASVNDVTGLLDALDKTEPAEDAEEEEETEEEKRKREEEAEDARQAEDAHRRAEDARKAEDAMWHRRAEDARRHLGRDESTEEREGREKNQAAADARRRLGRDESEKEREDREAEDSRSRRRRAMDTTRRAHDDPPKFEGEPKVTKKAMDEAIDAAIKKTREEAKATRDAENDVRPWVGALAMAHDSAEAVYRTALGALGVDVKDVKDVAALKHILHAQPKPGSRQQLPAMDAAGVEDFNKRFPDASRIGKLG